MAAVYKIGKKWRAVCRQGRTRHRQIQHEGEADAYLDEKGGIKKLYVAKEDPTFGALAILGWPWIEQSRT
jgi:hypothetical protein